MEKWKLVLIIIGALIAFGGGFIWINSRPISKARASAEIQKLIDREVAKSNTVTQGLVLVESGVKDYRGSFASGDGELKQIDTKQSFHVASVGKAFTAALIGILVDQGNLKFNDLIVNFLDDDLLGNLFVYNGVDYKDDVTVSQLLSHTSGVADYFEDPVVGSKSIAELVIEEPDHLWTPIELIEFSKKHQSSLGKPGEIFHYSDTGYILLGLIIEKVAGQEFHKELHQKILEPLKMRDTYLAFYSEPEQEKSPIADIWFNGAEISRYNSVSIDWAGGGIISTLDDLAIFVRELNSYTLVSETVLNRMHKFNNEFTKGIYYGLGFMEFHFTDFFPTLSFLPALKGHMGVLGTQMLYDKDTDTVYVCSFGSTDYAAGSVKTMIKVLSYVYRIKN